MVKQNNELLLRNNWSCLTSSTLFPEVNGISFERNWRNKGRGRGRDKNNQKRGRRTHNPSKGHNTPYNKRLNQNEIKQQENGKDLQYKSQKGHENKCYRCSIKGHWSCTCCSPKHLAYLYQTSLKEKGKWVEVNLSELGDLDDFLDTSNGVNVTHIKAFDFFKDINREVENLIGDQNDHIY